MWRVKVGIMVYLARLDGDVDGGRGVRNGRCVDFRERLILHVGGCSIPVEWYDFNFLKSWINERER